jgi:hypothetical protein
MKMGWIIVGLVVVAMSMDVAGGEVHHVVGGDHGWDPNSDILSWSSGKVFRVGDQICMSFSFYIFYFYFLFFYSYFVFLLFPPFVPLNFMSSMIIKMINVFSFLFFLFS